jgi:hypothetical protein
MVNREAGASECGSDMTLPTRQDHSLPPGAGIVERTRMSLASGVFLLYQIGPAPASIPMGSGFDLLVEMAAAGAGKGYGKGNCAET